MRGQILWGVQPCVGLMLALMQHLMQDKMHLAAHVHEQECVCAYAGRCVRQARGILCGPALQHSDGPYQPRTGPHLPPDSCSGPQQAPARAPSCRRGCRCPGCSTAGLCSQASKLYARWQCALFVYLFFVYLLSWAYVKPHAERASVDVTAFLFSLSLRGTMC